MNFKELEDKDLLRFIKLPLMISKESIIDTFSRILKDATTSFNPKVVIIDSITPILKVIGNDAEVRATLQNTLIEFSKLINGLTVLIHEVVGSGDDLGDIGFVSDAVIFMSCKIVNNLVSRSIEIRKSRGNPARITKVGFTIEEGEGIRVFLPLLLKEIPAPDYTKPHKHPCKSLDRKIGPIYPGELIFILYPTLTYIDYILAYITLVAIVYRGRVLVISYIIPPQHIMYRICRALERITAGVSITEELLSNYVRIEGLNPSVYLPEESLYEVLKLLREYNPNLIVFIGTPPLGIASTSTEVDYKDLIMNLIFYLRKMRVASIIIDARDVELIRSLSDMFIEVKNISRGRIFRVPHVLIEIMRRGEAPFTVTLKDFILCAKDIRKSVKGGITK